MKSYKTLQDAFNKLDQSRVAWHKSARFPKTMETANAVLYRNTVVDASTLCYLAHCLGLSNKQTIAILDEYAKEVPKKAAEVAVLRKLIAPVDLSASEQDLINVLRKLPDEKRYLVFALAGSL